MDDFRTEGITAITLYIIISFLLIIAVLIAGSFSSKAKDFSKKVSSHWKMSFIITIIYFISVTIGTGLSVISIIWSVGLYCQLLIGLSIAYSLGDVQPFPIAANMSFRLKFIRSCLLMIGIAVMTCLVIIVTSSISMGIGYIFGETSNASGVIKILPQNGVKAFFAILAGAGIMEGVTYRLIVLSLLLKLTRKRFLAILISAIIFAFYHFIPLNMMYKVYWQMPVTQFVNVFLGAIIIGYIYTKRGFETSVLSHTFADWIPLMAYIYFM